MNHKEANIIINGHKLNYDEAMTLRVVIASSLFDYSNPTFLGSDEHGRIMTRLYQGSCENIQDYIFDGLN